MKKAFARSVFPELWIEFQGDMKILFCLANVELVLGIDVFGVYDHINKSNSFFILEAVYRKSSCFMWFLMSSGWYWR